ncbi:MAG: C-GCAxxG-C-C family protein [Candidatus Electrothrix aestuarii]|uniref:C-GCAxxG-C-C family protein n=1 Tax=Candidatus Electrothrix aestuarii TaxID=3062594 RepID=A0AAU8LVZ0_9BACT|nr:C-GCAxxG-C-C family protein [Candidatus Electrothrix aestuarii]WPD21981.1 MAG: C-GCAxxG-C-C family protein [Candidatus Electrothrix sp. GW3-3]
MNQENSITEREKMADRATQLFAEGFHCSQAVLCACGELFRDEPPSPEVVAAMAPFAGGMGSTGKVCGALSGALATIGFTLGKTTPKQENHQQMCSISYAMIQKFSEITEQHGSIECSDIAQVDWKDKEAVQNFRTNPDSTRKNCVRVVRETSNTLYDLITEKLQQN